MPIPSEVLRAWRSAGLTVQVGEHAEPVYIPPAEVSARGAGHYLLWPSSWFVSAQDPGGVPADPRANQEALAQLRTSVGQSGLVALPATLRGEGMEVEGLVLRGAGRARAVALGYKRRQWAVLGIFPDRVEVVYTGYNSREA